MGSEIYQFKHRQWTGSKQWAWILILFCFNKVVLSENNKSDMDNEVIDYARGSLETPWRLSIFYGNPWTVVRGTSVLACPRVGMSFHHRGEINELFMPTGSTVLAKGRWSTTNVNCMLARCLLVEEEVVTACNIRTMAFFPFCKMHESGAKWQCTMPCRAI